MFRPEGPSQSLALMEDIVGSPGLFGIPGFEDLLILTTVVGPAFPATQRGV